MAFWAENMYNMSVKNRNKENRMKHHILAKFRPEVSAEQKTKIAAEVQELFDHTKEIEGITDVHVHSNCIARPNRYDILIVIEMIPEALEAYDACIWHKEWKEKYGSLLESKAIFDCE